VGCYARAKSYPECERCLRLLVGELYEVPWGIRVRETEELQAGEGEFIVEVKASGICTSDVKMARRGHPMLEAYGLPFIGGHEFAGEVIKLGAGVSGFSPGDRVVVSWINPCLECEYCKRGLFQFCVNTKDTLIQPAGFSEQVRVPAEHQKTRVYKFSDALDFELAALTEPMACALNGIENAGVKVGDTVVVMGAGFMGLLLVQLAQLSGAVRVVVVDGIPYRLELARELGATETINFRQTDVVSRVSELTGGLGADVVIEATGNIDAYRQAVELGRKGSTVLYFGGLAAGVKLDIDTNVIHYRQVTLKGSYSYTPETFRKALSIIESGRLKVGKLITHRYPLSELKEAYQKASEPDSLKVMISFD
jgi:L-iditol 2-dehydrogenase